MIGTERRKKRVSKKSKRAWRKHTDVQDVENFLEESRSEQRLGVDKLESKKDSELFIVDTVSNEPVRGKPRTRAERRAWAKQPSNYQLALMPTSAVQDPIKRNRVRTKEERKHPARKAKDLALREKGLMRKKAMDANKNRLESIKNNRLKRIKQKAIKFDKDVWSNEAPPSNVDDSWLGGDAKRQALLDCGEFKVRPPGDLKMPRSKLPKVEAPHPGLSYNPSLADHKELISEVVEKEVEMMKKDAHIARVTAPFKAKNTFKQEEWVDDILESLGIPRKDDKDKIEIKEEPEEEEDDKTGLVKKPLPKMKTQKQRRAQKRIRDEALQRKQLAAEKRKTTDIYRLRKIVSELDTEGARNEAESAAKQEAKCEHASVGTKRLARLKFQEPLQDFSTSWELSGSLRKLKAKSTLLRDRFHSMQKRNMLQPTTKIFKTKKRKVKVVVKRSHRVEEEVASRSRSKKMKIINSG